MNRSQLEVIAWELLKHASTACKPLLWLRDTDSALPLALELLDPLREAAKAVTKLPGARPALTDKLILIYERAIENEKPLVGIGAQARATRIGPRTRENGLLFAIEYAKAHREDFEKSARSACASGNVDWVSLFDLTTQFIDNLDWSEHVLENPRGQGTSLLLEAVELLDAARSGKQEAIRLETGDVFLNLMAFCLSLRIRAKDLAGPGAKPKRIGAR